MDDDVGRGIGRHTLRLWSYARELKCVKASSALHRRRKDAPVTGRSSIVLYKYLSAYMQENHPTILRKTKSHLDHIDAGPIVP